LRRGLWQTSTSTTKLSKCWVFIQIFGTPMVRCNSPMECRQTPTRNSPWKSSWPWRISLMKECRVSHSVWRELNKWFPMSIRELLGFQKGAPEQVDVHGGTLEGFYDHGRS
jgi:hypothetical protein